jgi:hypothetical protein
MMIIDQVIEVLSKAIPPKIGEEIKVCAVFPQFRLGVDCHNVPYLFFKSTLVTRRYSTFHKMGFTAEFFQKIDLIDNENRTCSDNFDFLKFTGLTSDENIFTLRVMSVLIEELSQEYESEKLKLGLDRLSLLLKNKSKKSNNSIQGLIGELLFIYDSSDVESTYLGWRANQNQKLDFQIGDDIFEIKTSKGNRIIIVEYNQVFNANDIEKINFVTYMINADGNDNIVTLMYRIYDKLPQEFKATFEEKFYNELGENIAEIENNKFDIELTKLSKIQVAAQELPITRIVDLHRSITTIKYSIDLDKL